MQARQRLIQLENAQLDAVWQATQAQADLLLALGMPSLIHAMLGRAEARCERPARGRLRTHRPGRVPPLDIEPQDRFTGAETTSVGIAEVGCL